MTHDVRKFGLVPTPGITLAAAGGGVVLAALAGGGPALLAAGAVAGLAFAVATRVGAHLSMCALEDMADRRDPGGSSGFEHP